MNTTHLTLIAGAWAVGSLAVVAVACVKGGLGGGLVIGLWLAVTLLAGGLLSRA